jgi:aromatic ring hydroxylase
MIALTHAAADLLKQARSGPRRLPGDGLRASDLGGDASNARYHGAHQIRAEHGTDYHAVLKSYLAHVYANELALGTAMTGAKGDPALWSADVGHPMRSALPGRAGHSFGSNNSTGLPEGSSTTAC